MRIVRLKNPDISYALIPWFVCADKTHLEIGAELYQRLLDKPDETFVIAALENGIGQAVLIAHEENDYIWVWQARAKEGFRYGHLLFNGLMEWAKYRGKHKLKCGLSDKLNENESKVLKRFYRHYGFRMCGNNDNEMLKELPKRKSDSYRYSQN